MDGEKSLAKAVIEQAIWDADRNSQNYDVMQARFFLCAINKLWEKSLNDWCEIADMDKDKIISMSRAKWGKDGRAITADRG